MTSAPYCNILNAIKHCDTSIITGPQLNRLPKQDVKLPDLEAHATVTLVDIRRKHDFERRVSLGRERDIGKVKDEVQKLRAREEQLAKDLEAINAGVSLEQQLEDNQVRLDELDMERKVLTLNIRNNKEDNMIYKNRSNLLELALRKSRIMLANQKELATKSMLKRNQAFRLLSQLRDDLSKLKDERDTQYEFREGAKEEFKELRLSNEDRAAHLDEVAERVMHEKDLTERQIQKLKLTHRFLEEMMRVKMEREMHRFKLIEEAFKSIKLATGVAETSELVNKFLNKEAAYGELLYKIAENEKKIDLLRVDNLALAKERKRLGEDMTMFEAPPRDAVDV